MPLISTNISPSEIDRLRNIRWKCRTDLEFLCREVLNYKDINSSVHAPILNAVQKFRLPSYEQAIETDIISPGHIEYGSGTWNKLYDLPGKRRMLLLYSRGTMKTTLNCIAHTIQFILNYPEATFLLFQSTGAKIKDIMREIKYHFQYNEKFRQIFPDYVPQTSRRIREFGNTTQFTVPDDETRTKRVLKYGLRMPKEPTVTGMSIEEGTAGKHVDCIKFSDIVEVNTVKTEEQIQRTIYAFNMAEKLLVVPNSWIDVEGTRYHYDDLYGDIINKWNGSDDIKPHVTDMMRKKWKIVVGGIYARDYEAYKGKDYVPKYTPDELDIPFKLDEAGNYVSIWPERFPVEEMEAEKAIDPYIFACQRLNDPKQAKDKVIFPLDDVWISRDDFRKINIINHTVTIDTAQTQLQRSDYSVVCVCAWDGYGRCYVHDIRVGKWEPNELIDHIFDVYAKYRPTKIRIEEDSYVRGLKPEISRREELKGICLPLEFRSRSNSQGKKDRIRNILQPIFKGSWIKVIKFDPNDKLQKQHPFHFLLIKQCDQFPLGHDDILDALSDQFMDRGVYGRQTARPDLDNSFYKNQDGSFTEEGFNHLLNAGVRAFPSIQQELFNKLLFPEPNETSPPRYGNSSTGIL